MEKEFANKKILVTGVGSGIGRYLAIRLASVGAEVYGISKNQTHLDSLMDEIPSIRTFCQDIAKWEATKAIVDNLPAMDGLVNNAGVTATTPFLEVEESEMHKLFEVNVFPIVNVSQTVAKKMIENGISGSIVNVSSKAALLALDLHTSYCASKGAVDQITRVMALELGPKGIRTNSVNPTVTLTNMARKAWNDEKRCESLLARIPMRKLAEPEDVAHAIMFLLSDKSKMVNGITLSVDGGYTAC